MKKRFFTLLFVLITIVSGVLAQEITSVTLTIKENGGESFPVPLSSSGFEDVVLEEAVTSLMIQKVEVETSGAVSDVAFVGTMYSTSEGGLGPDDEWRAIPLESLGNGKWVLEPEGEGIELVEEKWLSQNKNKTFEYFIQAKNSSGSDILFNNGGANYKVVFFTGEGGGSWKVKFYKKNTASLTIAVDGNDRQYMVSGDATYEPTDQPGQLSSLVIKGFHVGFIRNEDVTINDVSLQYKVFEEGQDGGWNRLDSNEYNEMSGTDSQGNPEHKMDYFGRNVNRSVTEGLEPGKNYTLEIMYQIIDGEGKYFFLGRDRNPIYLHFSLLSGTGIEAVHGSESLNSLSFGEGRGGVPVYNLQGQRVGKGYKGIVITNGKKMIVKD